MLLFDWTFKTFAANTILLVIMTNKYDGNFRTGRDGILQAYLKMYSIQKAYLL